MGLMNAQQTLKATLGSDASPLTRASRRGCSGAGLIAASEINSHTLPMVRAAVSFISTISIGIKGSDLARLSASLERPAGFLGSTENLICFMFSAFNFSAVITILSISSFDSPWESWWSHQRGQ